jgi:hypothetical protein
MSIGEAQNAEEGGIRALLQKNTPLVLGVLVVAIGAALWYSLGSMGKAENLAWFTTDDGKTYFADEFTQVAPFTSGGKEHLQVVVLSCDGGKTKKVGWLVRYPGEAKSRADNILKAGGGMLTGDEVKMPGDTEWLGDLDVNALANTMGRANNAQAFAKAQERAKKAQEIKTQKCPDGTFPVIVSPE